MMYRRTKTIYFSPTFKEYTGFTADIGYGCGACKDNTKNEGKCQECTADNCNAPVAVADFKCHSYTISEDAGKVTITKTGTATECKRLTSTDLKCNM